MIRLYSSKKAEKITESLSDILDQIERDYGVPAACMKAVLFREIKEIDLADLAADCIVRSRLLSRLAGRRDSSTGYAQIFAYVAINALNFAAEQGIENAQGLGLPAGFVSDPKNSEDIRIMWLKLNRDRAFNLRMAALNLLAASFEVNGHYDLAHSAPEELKKTFSRYNANTKRITGYGEEVYGYYLRFTGS